MNLDEVSRNIEVTLRGGAYIPESLKNNIINIVENMGNNPDSLKPWQVKILSALDKFLIETIAGGLTQVSPDIKDAVMAQITAKAQEKFPQNANIYLLYLMLKPEELKNVVDEIMTNITKIHGGAINRTLAIIITVVCIVVAAIVIIVVALLLKRKKQTFATFI